jgi:hypothetical protein
MGGGDKFLYNYWEHENKHKTTKPIFDSYVSLRLISDNLYNLEEKTKIIEFKIWII